MIDPKTLTIGSHVMVGGVRARVIRIDEPMENEIPKCTLIRFKAIIDGKVRDCGGSADSDKVEPILLAPELLKELGFKESDGLYSKEYNPGAYLFFITLHKTANISKVSIYSKGPSLECSFGCKYLHELESIVYQVAKTELINE